MSEISPHSRQALGIKAVLLRSQPSDGRHSKRQRLKTAAEAAQKAAEVGAARSRVLPNAHRQSHSSMSVSLSSTVYSYNKRLFCNV
jgi:hypothetical protein